jgi:single-strand DNA-binding protein
MSVNKVILVGRLGRDPETRYTPSGQQVCNFSIATDRQYKDRTGQLQKQTEWHRIVAWGKLAEICGKYLKKGSQVFIEGRIQSRQWEDQQGQKRTSFDIIANEMRMLGSRGEGAAPPPIPAEEETPAAGGEEFSQTAGQDEDIPF